MLSFTDHACVDFLPYGFVVIDPFETDVQQLNAKIGQLALRLFENFLLDQGPSFGDGVELTKIGGIIYKGFVHNRFAIFGGADNFNQFVFRDRVACFTSQNVVQARLSTAFVTKPKEILFGVHDAPPGKGVDLDIGLILGRHFVGLAVPGKNASFNGVDLLDEWDLEVQTGTGHGVTHGFAELRNDGLFGFMDGVGTIHDNE